MGNSTLLPESNFGSIHFRINKEGIVSRYRKCVLLRVPCAYSHLSIQINLICLTVCLDSSSLVRSSLTHDMTSPTHYVIGLYRGIS